MVRLVGVDLPRNKRMEVALTYIYGIGRSRARKICEMSGVDLNLKSDALNDDHIVKLRSAIEKSAEKSKVICDVKSA